MIFQKQYLIILKSSDISVFYDKRETLTLCAARWEERQLSIVLAIHPQPWSPSPHRDNNICFAAFL